MGVELSLSEKQAFSLGVMIILPIKIPSADKNNLVLGAELPREYMI